MKTNSLQTEINRRNFCFIYCFFIFYFSWVTGLNRRDERHVTRPSIARPSCYGISKMLCQYNAGGRVIIVQFNYALPYISWTQSSESLQGLYLSVSVSSWYHSQPVPFMLGFIQVRREINIYAIGTREMFVTGFFISQKNHSVGFFVPIQLADSLRHEYTSCAPEWLLYNRKYLPYYLSAVHKLNGRI